MREGKEGGQKELKVKRGKVKNGKISHQESRRSKKGWTTRLKGEERERICVKGGKISHNSVEEGRGYDSEFVYFKQVGSALFQQCV